VPTLPLVLALVALAAPAAAQQDEVDPAIADGSAQRALDAARERWRATGIRSYDFRVAVECFCTREATRPAKVRVRDGRPVRPPRRVEDVATVRRLQRRVQKAIDGRVAGLDVTYGRRGVPLRIGIDPDRAFADDETGYRAGRLRAR
jgi:hypothetical protein